MWKSHHLCLQVSILHGKGRSTLRQIDLTQEVEGAYRALARDSLVAPESRI